MLNITPPPIKDPDEVLDFNLDWSNALLEHGDDSITSSLWLSSNSALVIDSDSFVGNTTTVWLSGGDLGERYTLTNRVNTLGGRTYDCSFKLRVKMK